MTIYAGRIVDQTSASIEDFPSTLGQSVGAAAEQAFTDNPSKLLYDAEEVSRANTGDSLLGPLATGWNVRNYGKPKPEKVDRADAEEQVKSAGVKLDIPESGYSQAALDILIKRKRDEIQTADVLNRAPSSVVGSTSRFLARLAVGLTDPLNVASAFIPVVGEERAAAMIAKASGAFGRAGVRAGIGAAEGVVGQAVLEPLNQMTHSQLADDYTMADSLTNLAFGAAFGGGLHVGIGSLADHFKLPEAAAEAPSIKLSEPAEKSLRQIDVGKMSVEEFSQLYKDNPEVAKEIIASKFGDRPAVEDAPFAKGFNIESAHAQAVQELTPTFKAELLADAGNLADKGTVSALRAQIEPLAAELKSIQDNPEQAFKQYAKDLQAQGLSRKEAESQARKQLADRTTELQSQSDALSAKIDTNAKAEQAGQMARDIDKGNIPEQFQQRVTDRVNEIIGQKRLQEVLAPGSSARYAVAAVEPETRKAALSSAVAQMAQGRMPDVESIIRMDGSPESYAALKSASERINSPIPASAESVSANERIKSAPKSNKLVDAEAAESLAMEKLKAVQKNLEQGGITVDLSEMKPFDEAVKRSEDYGNAVRAAALCGLRS